MAAAPEPSLDDHLWTIAVARLILPAEVSLQAPPNLAYDGFPRLLEAGINDWGGVSPVTPDHVNPEAPWPDLDRLGAATAAAGLSCCRGSRCTRATCATRPPGSTRRSLPSVHARRRRPRSRAPAEEWFIGASGGTPPLVVAAAHRRRLGRLRRARSRRRTREAEVARLFAARGPEVDRLVGGGRRAARRAQRRRGHATSSAGTSTTPTSATSAAASARSPRASWPRTCAGPPTCSPPTRSCAACHEAWERGGTEVCLQGGIHPGFTGDWYTRAGRGDPGRAARPAHPRVLAARGLAGRGHARHAAARLPGAPARRRARLAARHGGRDPRRRGARACSARTRSRPRSGSR